MPSSPLVEERCFLPMDIPSPKSTMQSPEDIRDIRAKAKANAFAERLRAKANATAERIRAKTAAKAAANASVKAYRAARHLIFTEQVSAGSEEGSEEVAEGSAVAEGYAVSAVAEGSAGSAGLKRKWASDMCVARKRCRSARKEYSLLFESGPVSAENDRRQDVVHTELLRQRKRSLADCYYNFEVLGLPESVCRRVLKEELKSHLSNYVTAYMDVVNDLM